MAEKDRCKACGKIFDTKWVICPECGSAKKVRISMPEPYGED